MLHRLTKIQKSRLNNLLSLSQQGARNEEEVRKLLRGWQYAEKLKEKEEECFGKSYDYWAWDDYKLIIDAKEKSREAYCDYRRNKGYEEIEMN